jgi:hypothetical protein
MDAPFQELTNAQFARLSKAEQLDYLLHALQAKIGLEPSLSALVAAYGEQVAGDYAALKGRLRR